MPIRNDMECLQLSLSISDDSNNMKEAIWSTCFISNKP